MNTFLKVLKAKSRVFGAEGLSSAFWAASNRALTTKRKFIERSHVYFRVVKTDKAKAAEMKKLLGAQLKSDLLDKGHMGVRGLLYFDFSVLDANGGKSHLPGYARVRQHPDPERPGNKTFVYTWRKDLINLMCQPCSNRRGGRVTQGFWLHQENVRCGCAGATTAQRQCTIAALAATSATINV